MPATNENNSTERIWQLFSEKLRNFFLKRVSDEHVADDLLQETFVRIHRNLGGIEDEERLTGWVFRIARNLVIDHYRSKARRIDVALEESDGAKQAEENEEYNLNELIVGWLPFMIARLPEKYREAVELYELRGVSQQQIAEKVDISLSGAKSRVQRGREKLKTLLLECCSFELDQRGNVIGYAANCTDGSSNFSEQCDDSCSCMVERDIDIEKSE